MIEGNDNHEEFNNDFIPKINFDEIEFDLNESPKDYSDFLERRQPFDGTQSEVPVEEKERVKEIFSSTVDDCLLEHIESSERFEGLSHSGVPGHTRVHLEYDLGSDVDRLNIFVRRSDSERSISFSICKATRKAPGRYM